MDAVEKAKSGHPGMPMGMADVAYVLWTRFLKHNPNDPTWADRDRFVLSAGHGSMLLYSLLHLAGYEVSLEDLRQFRQLGSKTPGHPEYGHTPGVETTTGPLGQGFATGVGMAMAEAHLAARFNRPGFEIVHHHTYAIVSDGDLMEGIAHEAAALAGHLKLGRLIYLYDSNRISIDGSTDLTMTEDVAARFTAYGWHTVVIDGHDHSQIERAIEQAREERQRPSLIICRTHIGYGSPNKQDSEESHGAPLGVEEVAATKKALGMDPQAHFEIAPDVQDHFRKALRSGAEHQQEWQERMGRFAAQHPDVHAEFERALSGTLPDGWETALPVFRDPNVALATRKSSSMVIDALQHVLPDLMGGSADLSGSNLTTMKDRGYFSPEDRAGSNIHYGVREHAMGAAMNGMALHGGVIPFGGTFLVFADFCRPSIRLAALMGIRAIYVFTHDSIGLGEDGPTHQPIEHLASLRAMPNCTVLRPADANETSMAWQLALENRTGPSLLVLTRQNLPTLDRTVYAEASLSRRGAYVVNPDVVHPDVVLLSTGSEVSIALAAVAPLDQKGIKARVVSMPSWEMFRRQDAEYRQSVIPADVKARISIEAASTFGWREWIGDAGVAIGIDSFGASAPAPSLYEHFGLTVERLVMEATALVNEVKG